MESELIVIAVLVGAYVWMPVLLLDAVSMTRARGAWRWMRIATRLLSFTWMRLTSRGRRDLVRFDASARAGLGVLDEATRHLHSLDPNDPNTMFSEAQVLACAGDMASVKAALMRVTSARPDMARGWLELAMVEVVCERDAKAARLALDEAKACAKTELQPHVAYVEAIIALEEGAWADAAKVLTHDFADNFDSFDTDSSMMLIASMYAVVAQAESGELTQAQKDIDSLRGMLAGYPHVLAHVDALMVSRARG